MAGIEQRVNRRRGLYHSGSDSLQIFTILFARSLGNYLVVVNCLETCLKKSGLRKIKLK